MIYLMLTIFFSTLVLLIVRLFPVFKIHTLFTITLSFLFASLIGFIIEAGHFRFSSLISRPWFEMALLCGMLSFSVLLLYAWATRKTGLGNAAMAGRLSLVIPIMAGFMFFQEEFSYVKVVGIVFSLMALFFTFRQGKGSIPIEKRMIHYPVLLWLSQGITDMLFKFVQQKHIENEYVLFIATLFFIAMVSGFLSLIFAPARKRSSFRLKNLVAALILALANYAATITLLKSLDHFEIAILAPMIGIFVIASSLFLGYMGFRERFRRFKLIGIILAIISLGLLIW